MRKIYFLVVLLLTLYSLYAQAQLELEIEPCRLSVEKMFMLADSNNLSIKAHNTAIDQSREAVKVAKNAYLPSIDASLSLAYNGDGTILDRNYSNSFSVDIPSLGNNFALEVSQVVFAGGSITNGVKVAELQSELAVLSAESNRQDIRFLLIGNYLELCKMQNQLQVFDSNIEQTQKMLDNMRARYNEGTALQNDITRYELQLQNLNYIKTQLQNTMLILNNQMVKALGLSATSFIVPDINEVKGDSSTESKDYWQSVTAGSSTTLKSASTTVEVSKRAERISYSEKYPKVFIFAANYMNGPITIEIPAINKNFNYWYAGVGIKYSIDNLYKSGKSIKTSKLAVKHANEQLAVAEEQLQIAVDAAYIRYKEAFVLYETKQKSESLALQNYKVISYRYENDLSLITDLLDASSQKLDAELQVVNAQINIIYNYYKLKHISGTL